LILKKIKLQLKPLTPIHVWSGEELIYGLDVIDRDNKLCIIDFEKLPHELLEELVRVSSNRIPDLLYKYRDRIVCKELLNADSTLNEGSRIKAISSTLIPGSSLKGYIRTAIIYDLLNKLGKTTIINKLNSGIDLSKPPKNVSEGLEGALLRKPRPKRAGGFIDLLQLVLVSDPNIADYNLLIKKFIVYEILDNRLKSIGENHVIALTNGFLKYMITIIKPYNKESIRKIDRERLIQQDIDKLNEINRIDLIKSLKSFGCSILSNEIELVNKIPELRNYLYMLNNWKDKYCGENIENCVIARIGFMTGHLAKTILNIVRQYHLTLYKEILAYMTRQVKRVWDSRTIKLTTFDQKLVGIGWCELCLQEK